ncbi:MAG: hypothetical protein KF851_03470 [Pirellulaceae bacterium]|nr:hypothetical protein [Pirellulaceae bacterium]
MGRKTHGDLRNWRNKSWDTWLLLLGKYCCSENIWLMLAVWTDSERSLSLHWGLLGCKLMWVIRVMWLYAPPTAPLADRFQTFD